MRGGLRIALEQRNFCVGDIAGNTDKIMRGITGARDADLVVFPELALTGYPPEDLLLRDDFLRASNDALLRLADAARGVDVVVGAPVREDGVLFNSAVWLRDGGIHRRCDKRCLPNYGVFDEQRYFRAGGEPAVVEVAGVRCGVTVCEDLWDDDAASSMRGATDLVLNCSASPFHVGKSAERRAMLARRAREMAAPVAYVNLVGGQDELVFDGDSCIVGASGERACSARRFTEERLAGVLEDGDMVQGRRAAPMSEVEKVWRAVSLGLGDYIHKSGFDSAVVGVSGGVDSAVVLTMLSEVLGGERVRALMLPSPYTSEMSLEDARAVAENCGARYEIMPINSVFESALKLLGDAYADNPTDLAGQNLQSRIRGVLLMACANKDGSLLVTTGNKSEMAVGYATLYGDMAGAYAPLKDVSKARVYELAGYCNRERERIPRRIIERPPTAELSPGQLDSHSLPSYGVLDEIIELFVEGDASPGEVATRGRDAAEVRRVQDMVYASEYKRRQAPPGPRITRKAFGKDRRFPIVSRFRAGQ